MSVYAKLHHYGKYSMITIKKGETPYGVSPLLLQLAFFSHTSEAFAAVYRTVRLWLKRNLSLATACCASCAKVLAWATGGSLACVTADFAALWLVLEASFSVEFLLAGSEYELVAAFFTDKCFVFVHGVIPSL